MEVESVTLNVKANVICAACGNDITEAEFDQSRCDSCGVKWIKTDAEVNEKDNDYEATVRLLPRNGLEMI